MAAPVDAGRIGTSAGSTAAQNKACDLPASIAAGDLLVLVLRSAGADTHSLPDGWTWLVQNDGGDATDDVTSVFWRVADGNEGSSVTVNGTASVKYAAICWRITGASASGPLISSPAYATTATAIDPPSHSPAGGSKDYLWIWLGAMDGESTSPPSGNPTNYSNPVGSSSASAGATTINCRIAGATRQLTGATEDPPSWTISAAPSGSTAWTIAVPPPGSSASASASPSVSRSPSPSPSASVSPSASASPSVSRSPSPSPSPSESASPSPSESASPSPSGESEPIPTRLRRPHRRRETWPRRPAPRRQQRRRAAQPVAGSSASASLSPSASPSPSRSASTSASISPSPSPSPSASISATASPSASASPSPSPSEAPAAIPTRLRRPRRRREAATITIAAAKRQRRPILPLAAGASPSASVSPSPSGGPSPSASASPSASRSPSPSSSPSASASRSPSASASASPSASPSPSPSASRSPSASVSPSPSPSAAGSSPSSSPSASASRSPSASASRSPSPSPSASASASRSPSASPSPSPSRSQSPSASVSPSPSPSPAEGYALTVNGVEKKLRPGWSIKETVNGRNTFAGEIVDATGAFRLANDDVILFTEDETRIYGGLVVAPGEGWLGDPAWVGTVQRLSAVDFNAYADRRRVTAEIPAGTLKAALQVLAPYLTDYGVAIDPAQADGPDLPALSYQTRKLADVLAELSTVSNGWMWEIDYVKGFRMTEAGTRPAPFNIAAGDGHLIGDVDAEIQGDDYANYVVLLAGTGEKDLAEALGTGDGSQTTWDVAYTPSLLYLMWVGATLVDGWPSGGVAETLALVGDTGATWNYDPATRQVTRAAGPVADGSSVIITMKAALPLRRTADGGAPAGQRVERTYSVAEVSDKTVAQAIADSYLARDSVRPKVVKYETAARGVHPGQTQTITLPARNLSGTFLITEVEITNVGGNEVRRRVTAVGATRPPADWRDTVKQWAGSGASAAAGSVTIVQSGGGGVGGTGTAGAIPKWATATTLGDSILTESGATVTVAGTLAATTLQGALGLGYVGGFGGAGTFARSTGSAWAASTLTLPDAATAGRVVYATGTDAWGESANLAFDGTTLAVTGNATISGYAGTPTWVGGQTGWRIDGGGNADFRWVYADELHAKSFVADLEMALAGGQIISKSVAVLAVAFTVPALGAAGTLRVRDLPSAADMAAFESGDAVVLRQFSRAAGALTIADCVGVVTNYADQADGTQTWTFTRNSGANGGTATGGTTVGADGLALDFGVSGNGYYEVNAFIGAYGASAPYAQIVKWTTAPTGSNRFVTARFGNLVGLTGSLEYGFYAQGPGNAVNDYRYLRMSDLAFQIHGVDLSLWDGSAETIKLEHDGPSFALGSPLPAAFGTGNGVWMGNDGGTYKFRVGNPSGNRITWDGSALAIVGDGGGVTNINGANIQTGTVRVSSFVAVGGGGCLTDDPDFRDSAAWTGTGNTCYLANIGASGKVGDWALFSSNGVETWPTNVRHVAIDPAKTYRVRCWAYRGSANGYFYFGTALFNGAGNELDANGDYPGTGARWFYGAGSGGAPTDGVWTEYSALFGAGTAKTIPAAGKTMAAFVGLNYGGSAGYYVVQDLRIEEVLPSTLIRDGAITTDKIYANAVTAAKIAAGTITANEVAAGTFVSVGGAAGDVNAGTTTISGGKITASSIAADRLSVATLSAITANLGTVNAGSVSGVTISGSTIYAGSGNEVTLNSSGITLTAGSGGPNQLKFSDGSFVGSWGNSVYVSGWMVRLTDGTTGGSCFWSSYYGGLYPGSALSLGLDGSRWGDLYLSGRIFIDSPETTNYQDLPVVWSSAQGKLYVRNDCVATWSGTPSSITVVGGLITAIS